MTALVWVLILAPILWAVVNMTILFGFPQYVDERSWYWRWGYWIPAWWSITVCAALWVRTMQL